MVKRREMLRELSEAHADCGYWVQRMREALQKPYSRSRLLAKMGRDVPEDLEELIATAEVLG